MKQFKQIWNIFMALLYTAMGVLLLVKGPEINNFPDWINLTIGVLIVSYGLFRFIRIFWKSKKIENYNNE